MNNRHDENLIILTRIAWVVFNILFLLGTIGIAMPMWRLCIELWGNGWWSILPLCAVIGIDIAINLLFAHELRGI